MGKAVAQGCGHHRFPESIVMTCLSREKLCCAQQRPPATGRRISVGHNISAEDTYPRTCWIQHVLGFVFICGRTRKGKFQLKRKSRRDRMRAKLSEIKEELWRRMHQAIPEQGRWLAARQPKSKCVYVLVGARPISIPMRWVTAVAT